MKLAFQISALGNLIPLKMKEKRTSAPMAIARPRQILVDVSVIMKNDVRTGIQRVVRAICLDLQRRDLGGFVVRPVFATAGSPYAYAPDDFLLSSNADSCRHANEPVDVRPGDIFLGLDLAAHLLPRHERQIRTWKQQGASIHIIVYDLLPVSGANWFNNRTQRNFAKWLGCIARQADQAICISDQVADDLHQWAVNSSVRRTVPLKINTIPLGADIAASGPSSGIAASDKELLSVLGEDPFVLMVGTIEPRKGYGGALDAFEQLWRENVHEAPRLVIAGRPGWKTDTLQKRLRRHPEAGKRLFWFDAASDQFLETLYRSCRGVLLASFAEGFGLPAVEAISFGKPVLLRDIPVFRELTYGRITYFDDDQPGPFAARIMEWLDSLNRSDQRNPGLTPPSWRQSTDSLLTALNVEFHHSYATEKSAA